MKPTYKQVKILKPHCSICGERLQGNGSIVLPYKCSCGEWEWEWHSTENQTSELKLKQNEKEK